MGFIIQKKRLIIIISSLLVIINYLLLLNIGSKTVFREESIRNTIYKEASITDLIYSKKFDNNDTINKYRKNIILIYTITDLFNVEKEKIDQIVESNIFKEVLVRILINIINSIKDDKQYQLFSINDYNNIVDGNIDDVLNKINLNKNSNLKTVIVTILKRIGSKSFDDVSTTNKVVDNIPNYKVNIIHIIFNNNIMIILLVIDILLLGLLFIISKEYKYIISIITILSILLLLTNLYLLYLGNRYNNEWHFIKTIINKYNSNICIYTITCFIIFIISLFINKAKNTSN